MMFYFKKFVGFDAVSVTSCVQLDGASLFLACCGLNVGLIVLSVTHPLRNDSFHSQSLFHALCKVQKKPPNDKI